MGTSLDLLRSSGSGGNDGMEQADDFTAAASAKLGLPVPLRAAASAATSAVSAASAD